MNIVQYCFYKSPVGDLLLAGNKEILLLLGLPQGKSKPEINAGWQHNPEAFPIQRQQLAEYFAGTRKAFDFPYELLGSAFQAKVLKAVASIPYGATASYSEIAQNIKQPQAIRAVGGANAKNPLPIVIPCHRVIGKKGTLTGFGGGLELKTYLLNLENAIS